MGRGRQKAKQTKVARKLKYYSPETDLEALARELSNSKSGQERSGSYDSEYDEYSKYDEYDQYDEYDEYDEYAGDDKVRDDLDDWESWATSSR